MARKKIFPIKKKKDHYQSKYKLDQISILNILPLGLIWISGS